MKAEVLNSSVSALIF